LTESGEWEDLLPDPILLGLSVAQGLEGSVAYRMWIAAQAIGTLCGGGRTLKVNELLGGELVNLWAAHPSGALSGQAKCSNTDIGRRAKSVRLKKTPFELMQVIMSSIYRLRFVSHTQGEFFLPPKITFAMKTEGSDENFDYECIYDDEDLAVSS
jgi:hypothetical protein